ncbi:YihY/virulence factor BrkB family protein [Dietzia sp. ANT_WB102]|uniref:YihY/virulence factor BrkB family protein n=1 Tax=Dietzia sp. ANT_WB102 TaxID=2597345 RepID=UPI0011EC4BF4|nr:YihY/virulence factor BrkB family protein [Dietzia sp. ANT_WB102]KAA0918997.1 YihY/virulence factor BrkB family protein [Dietzia sp. ANT_WB102]
MTRSQTAPARARRGLHTVRLVLTRSVSEFLRDRGPDLAGSLTFYGVLSLFPALLVVISLLGVFGQGSRTVDAVMDMLSDVAQPELLDPIRGPIEALVTTPAAGTALIIGTVVALWSASRYVWALGRAMNAVLGIEEGRPVWRLLPAGLLLTALLIGLVTIGGLALVFSGPVAETVGGWIGLGGTALAVWSAAKWPAALVSAVIALAVLYRFAPNVSGRRISWVSLGAAAALVIIGAATVGFGFFVSNVGSFNRVYGSLAGVIVFLFWLWLVNMAVVFGAHLDAEVLRVRQLRAGIPAEEELLVTPRDTRASDWQHRHRAKMIAAYRELRRDPPAADRADALAAADAPAAADSVSAAGKSRQGEDRAGEEPARDEPSGDDRAWR